ncbi:MAG: hypothetical protein QM493_10460 [Sulfurovum sp.]
MINQIIKLAIIEATIVEMSYSISDRLGDLMVDNAIKIFDKFLQKTQGISYVAQLNPWYRQFIIEFLKAIDGELYDKVFPIVLSIRDPQIETKESK